MRPLSFIPPAIPVLLLLINGMEFQKQKFQPVRSLPVRGLKIVESYRRRRFSCMNRKAMTLTELLIVVAIIAIISALSMPTMLKSIEKGKVGEASTNLNFIRTAQKHYFLANSTFSSDIDSLPIENPNDQASRYFYYEASQAGDDLLVDFTARATRGGSGAQPVAGGYGYYYEISKDGDITSNGPLI